MQHRPIRIGTATVFLEIADGKACIVGADSTDAAVEAVLGALTAATMALDQLAAVYLPPAKERVLEILRASGYSSDDPPASSDDMLAERICRAVLVGTPAARLAAATAWQRP